MRRSTEFPPSSPQVLDPCMRRSTEFPPSSPQVLDPCMRRSTEFPKWVDENRHKLEGKQVHGGEQMGGGGQKGGTGAELRGEVAEGREGCRRGEQVRAKQEREQLTAAERGVARIG